jgi:transcription initiation factor IIE alpha subunit
MVKGYCLKCKAKVELESTKLYEKGNRYRVKGTCPKCDKDVSFFVSKDSATSIKKASDAPSTKAEESGKG